MLKKPGFVETKLLHWLTREAHVARLETLSEHFRLVDLEGEALKDHDWAAGQKIQMQLGGFVSRTFTPMLWDCETGTTRFLAYLHGDAPAARWARELKPGDSALLFGPRRSMNFAGVKSPFILFGDETSFGLAYALAASGAAEATFIFEVTSVVEARPVLAALGITSAQLIERAAGDAHMDMVETALMQALETQDAQAVALTGKSVSIQRLSRALKKCGLTSAHIMAKAYWAPGKTGLD